jgi:hypothetical protein
MELNGPIPRASVVIPTYNRAHVVGEAISSVLTQQCGDLELVVVDDGSTDGTAELLSRVGDGRLRYVAGRHAGVAAARNLGVKHARGDVIAFLDSDDLWRPEKLGCDLEFLDRHPEAGGVFTDLEKLDGGVAYPSFMRETSVFARRLGAERNRDDVVLAPREMRLILLEEVPIKPSALAVRRAAFEQAGGFDEGWSSSEDWEFLLRFARTQPIGYVDRPLAVLRVGDDSLHRLDQDAGDRAMLALLVRERADLAGDAEAQAAVRRGLVSRVKHLAWHHVRAGRRISAAAAFARGFALTRDPGLLLRAVAALAPWRAARADAGVRSVARGSAGRPAPRSTA